MGIPAFNDDGNLPEGVHVVDEADFLEHFAAGSYRRQWPGERVKKVFALAKLSGRLERLFIWGSFVSAKESPNDLDLLLLMQEDFDLENTPEACKVLGSAKKVMLDNPANPLKCRI